MTTELNIIKAEFRQTVFSKTPHLTITVDGRQLDQIINDHYPDRQFSGLVPTLLDWLDSEQERKIVWDRFASDRQIVPLLMCPDDCDLWCTVIVADSEVTDNKVVWKKIGVDKTDSKGFTPDKIGQAVEWLDKIKPMAFSLDSYRNCIDTFKNALIVSLGRQ